MAKAKKVRVKLPNTVMEDLQLVARECGHQPTSREEAFFLFGYIAGMQAVFGAIKQIALNQTEEGIGAWHIKRVDEVYALIKKAAEADR